MDGLARAASKWNFGVFEMEGRTAELRRNGIAVKLQEQPAQLLLFLLEHAGEIVTREDLREKLWAADTFVDFDHALNTAVMKLREALGDVPERPVYIQTIPRKGYRFVAPVKQAVIDPPQAASAKLTQRSREEEWLDEGSERAGFHHGVVGQRWIVAGVLLIVVISLANLVAGRHRRRQSSTQPLILSARPFTALPGRASSPAFSPDGSRIAFAWNGDPSSRTKGFDLYVKALGSETLLRLTQRPSEWVSPAWSPDGTQIAFHRMDGAETGIYVVPTLGGPERKLRSTQIRASDYAVISWSPDGKWIAFADQLPSDEHTRLHLLSVETLDAKEFPIDPGCLHEGLPAFSNKGEHLAYWCLRRSFDSVLYLLPMGGGQPKALSFIRAFATGLTWSAADERLVYSHTLVGSQLPDKLGEFSLKAGSARDLEFTSNAQQPTVWSKGAKLAYSSVSARTGIWRRDLMHPESLAVELMPSSRSQLNAQYSPDGNSIAFASLRTGLQGVWIGSTDGANLVQLSDPARVSGSPQWSPDGSKVAFDSLNGEYWEIYEADVSQRRLTKLVTNLTNVIRPHWSRDGKSIYFSSQESGRMGIYRCPASGGDAVLVSRGTEEIDPRESTDGKFVLFASSHAKSTLRQVPVAPQSGAESKVDGMPEIEVAELWTLTPNGIYFVPAGAPRSLRYFDLATKQVRSIFEVTKDFGSGLSISPGGRWIMYSLVGDDSSDIMLVDHFR